MGNPGWNAIRLETIDLIRKATESDLEPMIEIINDAVQADMRVIPLAVARIRTCRAKRKKGRRGALRLWCVIRSKAVRSVAEGMRRFAGP